MAKPQPSDDAQLGREVSQQYLFAKRYLDPLHERFNMQEELYRTYINPANYPHTARVFDPRIFRIIETITPRMVANEPTGTFYPVEGGDVTATHILNALLKYDWRRAEMFPKLVTFVKSMLIFGTSFGRVFWDYRECEKMRMKPQKLNGKLTWTPKSTEKVAYTEFDGPNFEALNIYDCFPDPNATSVSSMRWFIYRMFKTVEELEQENDARGAEYWKNLDQLKEAMKEKGRGRSPQQGAYSGQRPQDLQFREHRRMMLSTEELVGQDTTNPDITVLVRYTRDRWVFVCPEYNNLVIRDVQNPYFHGQLPIVCGVDYPYPGELYGMGEIEPLDRIQRAINAVLNQRLDNVQLTLRTMWKVKKGAQVDMHTLVSAPGNVITTGDMNAVEPVQVPDVTGPTFVQTMNYLTAAMQNGSGVTDYTQGIQTDQNVTNNTATGIRLVQQEANAQFKLKIQLFNRTVIEAIANQWKDLRVQYTTESQKLRILGRDSVRELRDQTNLSQIDEYGQPIVPGDLATQAKLEIGPNEQFAFLNLLPDDIQPAIVGDYDFIAKVSQESLTDPIAMQQNFMIALNQVKDPAWQQSLAQQGKRLNTAQMTQDLFDNLNLGIEAEHYLEDLPAQPQQPGEGQPLSPEQISAQLEPMQNPFGVQPMGAPMQQGVNPSQPAYGQQPATAA